jgi:hypothetical protein
MRNKIQTEKRKKRWNKVERRKESIKWKAKKMKMKVKVKKEGEN